MSHVTKLSGIVITDLGAVRQAVASLNSQGINVRIVENAKPRVHGYDSVETCDLVLKLDGAYDVGLKRNAEGNYEPVLDVYQGHVGRYLGATCPVPGTAAYASQEYTQHQIGRFLQEYGKHVAMNAAMAAGHVIESCDVDADGNVQIILAVV
jgi:hypothetical protein